MHAAQPARRVTFGLAAAVTVLGWCLSASASSVGVEVAAFQEQDLFHARLSSDLEKAFKPNPPPTPEDWLAESFAAALGDPATGVRLLAFAPAHGDAAPADARITFTVMHKLGDAPWPTGELPVNITLQGFTTDDSYRVTLLPPALPPNGTELPTYADAAWISKAVTEEIDTGRFYSNIIAHIAIKAAATRGGAQGDTIETTFPHLHARGAETFEVRWALGPEVRSLRFLHCYEERIGGYVIPDGLATPFCDHMTHVDPSVPASWNEIFLVRGNHGY